MTNDERSPGASARPILISGAASGMGLATARLLSRAGHPVALLDRDADGVAAARSALEADGGRAAAQVADVTDEERTSAAIAALRVELGPFWGVAAAAGVLGTAAPLADTSVTALSDLLAVNVVGLHVTLREATRAMRERADGGRIVVWSSDASIGGVPGFGAYALAKAAVTSMCLTLAVELGRHGITANALVPGPVATPMAAYVTPEMRRASEAAFPIGRWPTADEVAGAAAYLMTDAAASITGVVLPVDGGRLAAVGRL
jgi:NAD(P)-dependent dehydrogenase (short-subunit alcohol dehydrogenase family)